MKLKLFKVFESESETKSQIDKICDLFPDMNIILDIFYGLPDFKVSIYPVIYDNERIEKIESYGGIWMERGNPYTKDFGSPNTNYKYLYLNNTVQFPKMDKISDTMINRYHEDSRNLFIWKNGSPSPKGLPAYLLNIESYIRQTSGEDYTNGIIELKERLKSFEMELVIFSKYYRDTHRQEFMVVERSWAKHSILWNL